MVDNTRTTTTSPAQTVIEANGLVKQFGDVRALDGLDLTIRKGELFGLLGPNGSGKTTFIRMVAGLVRPTSGNLTVLGHPVPAQADKVRYRLGYMTQQQALYGDLSVWENIQFFARIFGLDDKKARDLRCDEVLDLVELGPRKGSLTGNLSGGLKQRLSLACALVHNPELLLLDEPTVGSRSGAQAKFLGLLPHAECPWRNNRRIQPRYGRGRPLRPARANANRQGARSGHALRNPRTGCQRQPGRSVPDALADREGS